MWITPGTAGERNPRAIAFYRKFGFVDVGAHEFRLGADVQTDRVMVRGLGITSDAGRSQPSAG